MKKFICLLLLCFHFQNSYGQNGKYLVVFKDKNNSEYSISNPLQYLSSKSIARRTKYNLPITEHDLPPNQSYVNGLKAVGATVWYTSKWLNAALIIASESVKNDILNLPYVKGIEYNDALDRNGSGVVGARKLNKWKTELDNFSYGSSATNQIQMLGTNHLHNNDYKGDGMLIAVIDDGFNNVDKSSFMAHLFTENKIVKTFDFVFNTPNVYSVGGHGHNVLSDIAARTPGVFVGTAPNAHFALLRSENAPNERLIEEANYLFACEMADSLGADLINTSLGYDQYDYSGYNHTPSDFNGDKVLSTRAADWAAAKGILLCISAGNSGSYCGSPADADSVLTVGAVNANEVKVGFSSFGLTADGRKKPDIAAKGSGTVVSTYSPSTSSSSIYGSSGTSFSSPTLCGFAACYWQANPTKSAQEIIQMIKMMGSQVLNPDALLGYGVPRIRLALDKETAQMNISGSEVKSLLTAESSRVVAQVKPSSVTAMPVLFNYKNFIDNTVQMLPRPYVQRHVEITPNTSSTSMPAKVVLFFKQSEFDDYNTAIGTSYLKLPSSSTDNSAKSNIKVLKVNGLGNQNADLISFGSSPEIIDPVDSDIIWNNNEKIWEVSFDVTGFSNFYLGTDIVAAPLAVSLKSFQVVSKTNTLAIKWVSFSEINHKNYELQRSENSKDFETIYTTNQINQSYYQYEDDKVKLGQVYYYRLKMASQNNEITYSKIISGRIKDRIDFGFNIANHQLIFETNLKLPKKINAFNSKGQLIWTIQTNETQVFIPKDLKGQLYKFQVNCGDATKVKKVLLR